MTNFEHLAEGPTTEEMTRRGKKLTWLRPKSFWGTWKAHEQRRGSNPVRLAFKSHASAKRPSCSTSGMTVSESASCPSRPTKRGYASDEDSEGSQRGRALKVTG